MDTAQSTVVWKCEISKEKVIRIQGHCLWGEDLGIEEHGIIVFVTRCINIKKYIFINTLKLNFTTWSTYL